MASLARCGRTLQSFAFTHKNVNSSQCLSGVRRSMSNVGFVGLGQMGSRMAKNVMEKGHKLAVYDVSPEAMTAMEKLGARVCQNLSEVTKQADVLITMLPNNTIVLDTYEREKGILDSVKKGTLLIDSSTVDPTVSQKIATLAEKKGAIFLDAPVSGGVIGAQAGTLTFMVGGREADYQAAKEVLQSMGGRIELCGPTGMGQAAKICNNMLLGISMAGVAETMNLGMRLGLDKKLLMNIINSSTGRCWSSELYNPVPGTLENVPSNDNYRGGFITRLMAKDLGLAQDAATKSMSPTPMGSLAHQLYKVMMNRGFADKDFASVYQFLVEEDVSK